jgi:hypothetical protein
MKCVKDDLYRNLIQTKRSDDATGIEFPSARYLAIVDAIKEHDRSGHDGQQPCPDAGY